MKVEIFNHILWVSPLELQIVFKEQVLRSPKDIQDARHIRMVAKGHLDQKMIKDYGMRLHGI